MLWNTKPVCCHRVYLPAHSNCILFLHHHVHIIVIQYTVLYMCLLTHVSTVLIINLLPRELYSAGTWFKRPFSQLKEDQLLNWKTAYVSCNNEAAADTDTSHTQSITLDSLSMWHTHTHLFLPLLSSQCVCVCGRMFCMHFPCPCLCVCMCVCLHKLTLLCVKWRTLCTWRHTSTCQEQTSAQDLSHIQLFTHKHTRTHTAKTKMLSAACVRTHKNTFDISKAIKNDIVQRYSTHSLQLTQSTVIPPVRQITGISLIISNSKQHHHTFGYIKEVCGYSYWN